MPVAADESIRKAGDPLAVVRAGAADIAVLKVAPLGGISAMLKIAAQIDIPVVVSSALDSAVGIAVGLAAAAALPNLDHACGLGTGRLFVEDVPTPSRPSTATCRSGRSPRTRRGCRRWPRRRSADSGGSTGSGPAIRCCPDLWGAWRRRHGVLIANTGGMTRKVLIVGFPGVQALDLVGPFDVFAGASKALAAQGKEGYQPELASLDGQPVATGTGLTFGTARLPNPPEPRRHPGVAGRSGHPSRSA